MTVNGSGVTDSQNRIFGRTTAQAARGALLLALLGTAAVVMLDRSLTRPGTVAGEALRNSGIPDWVPTLLGVGGVAVLAGWGFIQSLRARACFSISPTGWKINGPGGAYLLDWKNVTAVEATTTGAIGFRVSDRAAVIASHRGTEQHRAWLATQEPYGEWDYLFTRAELGTDASEVMDAIETVRGRDGASC